MPRLARAFAFALCLLAAPAVADGSVVTVATDDPAMVAAIDAAQASLSKVLDVAIDDTGRAHAALTLKVAFPVEVGEVGKELIWVGQVARTEDGLTGTLDNDPVYMSGVAYGDEVQFTEDMVADWGLMWASGKIFGHYTTRVLLDRMPADEADEIRALLSDDPVPLALQ